MKTLIFPSDIINNIWGEIKEDPKKEYKCSVFCLKLDAYGKEYLYHTLTGELLEFDQDESVESFRSFLISHLFLVPLAMNELKFVDDTRAVLGRLSAKKTH